MSVARNGAAAVAPTRAHAIETFRRYERVFGPAFRQAVRDASRRAPSNGTPVAALPRPEARVVERTRTVVKDGGWRAKCETARAAVRAVERELKSVQRQLADERQAARLAASERAEAVAEAKREAGEARRLADRLAASAGRVERLRGELDAARTVTADAAERASVSEMVREAERRVEQAELRAARAERIAAEHGAAVTGELRALTAAELAELKANGPAGSAVLAKALKRLARARAQGGKGVLAEALMEVARAAVNWVDRL